MKKEIVIVVFCIFAFINLSANDNAAIRDVHYDPQLNSYDDGILKAIKNKAHNRYEAYQLISKSTSGGVVYRMTILPQNEAHDFYRALKMQYGKQQELTEESVYKKMPNEMESL
jgi:hypothetical protein